MRGRPGSAMAVALFGACAAVVVATPYREPPPLRLVADVPLPGRATRFDYQSFDPRSGRLYISHMGDGRLVVFDTRSNRVLADLPGYSRETGVLYVPQLNRVYASAAGAHEVVAVDARTLNIVARVTGAQFPDGIAYDPVENRVFVSDEAGGIDLVIDGATNRRVTRIDLGGEAGNTHYDPVSRRIYVAVQTRNEMAAIDPETDRVVARYPLPGSDRPHGFLIDAPHRLMFVSCEGNAKLLIVDMRRMRVTGSFDVGAGPDVLALDPGLGRLYVACESAVVSIFDEVGRTLRPHGEYRAPNAHSVAVDPRTHRVYLPLRDVGGRPVLRVLAAAL